MIAFSRILDRLNYIERKYGDVALAAAFLCFTIGAYGALAQISLHNQAGVSAPARTENFAAQTQQIEALRFAEATSPIDAITNRQHEIALARAEQLGASVKSVDVAYAPTTGGPTARTAESGQAIVSASRGAPAGEFLPRTAYQSQAAIAPRSQSTRADSQQLAKNAQATAASSADTPAPSQFDYASVLAVSALTPHDHASDIAVSALSASETNMLLELAPRSREVVAALAQ